MRSPAVTALSHDDEGVSRSLSIVGALYACRNPQVLRISARERRDVMVTWLRHKAAVEGELETPDAAATKGRFRGVFLSSLLLAVVELMAGKDDGSFQVWLARVSNFVRLHAERRGMELWTPFERDLIRFFRFLDLLSAISRREMPVEPQVAPEPWPARPPELESTPEAGETPDAVRIDAMLSTMWEWAVLQRRIHDWIALAEGQHLSPPETPDGSEASSREQVGLRVQGLDIVCEATALQSRMITNLSRLSLEPEPEPGPSIGPYYRWVLTGVTHNLRHPAWQSLGCELPVMPPPALHEQALAALGCVETLVGSLGLDIAMYLPFADFVGREMGTEAERARMLRFLDVVKGKGFDLADDYRTYLVELWEAVGPWEVSAVF
ncbi:hypothetical protein CSOJ01_07969 [Colletotrichum sojae]|uniref:Uncharacterized protein n=1 Tax=Colletotrichum sojae TaxID=2175907 RepID=A0A8H6MSQ9_9PEZI|nr:hypothetical protein CSOJ01_07969 [Colletotrichum sojae]